MYDRTNSEGGGSPFSGRRETLARPARAFTLIEVMLVVAIISVLSLIAFPSYSQYIERGRVAQAVADILELNMRMERYKTDHGAQPDDLSAMWPGGKLDPWGRPYEYLNLQTKGNQSKARKNKKLTPINSDYDLYSAGKNGQSVPPLTAKSSQDDVVRANDGSFVDLASKYTQ